MECRRRLGDRQNRLAQLQALLRERSPLVILSRGYSITRDASGKIIRDADQVSLGDQIMIRLAKGELGASVGEKK